MPAHSPCTTTQASSILCCAVLSCAVLCCAVLSCPVLPCHFLSCPALSCCTCNLHLPDIRWYPRAMGPQGEMTSVVHCCHPWMSYVAPTAGPLSLPIPGCAVQPRKPRLVHGTSSGVVPRPSVSSQSCISFHGGKDCSRWLSWPCLARGGAKTMDTN